MKENACRSAKEQVASGERPERLLSPLFEITTVALDALKPNLANTRTHSGRQIKKLARSIKDHGLTKAIGVDRAMNVIFGHACLEALKLNGETEAPVVVLKGSAQELRKLALADNRIALEATWNTENLAIEIEALLEAGGDGFEAGFDVGEIDALLSGRREASPFTREAGDNAVPDPTETPVTRAGDLWLLGRHRLYCGDARDAVSFESLLLGDPVDAIIADAPYNTPIANNVSGKGKVRHGDFAMASGEMTADEYKEFLEKTFGHCAQHANEGAIVFSFIDWRQLSRMQAALETIFTDHLNTCVWAKTTPGLGSFYRSQHELVLVFKKAGAHTNNIKNSAHGRTRSNVWTYAGLNSWGNHRNALLADHPTPKPVGMLEDMLRDVTRRGQAVLDPFGGSGSTLIAAEKCGREARLIEIDPRYCDAIIARFEAYTGRRATLAEGGAAFEEVTVQRGRRT